VNFRFFLFDCCLFSTFFPPLFAPSSAAQNVPQAFSDFAAGLPNARNFEGTVEAVANGQTTRARLQFQAPDRLRIEIEAGDNTRAQTIVASGEETRFYDPSTRRVQRLPYNLARQWWRGWGLSFGGPANFLFNAAAPAATSPFYLASAPAAGELLLTAQNDALQTEPRKLISDSVNFGGGGDRIFYAPFKRWVWNRPNKIALQRDAANGQITRVETDDNEQTFTASISLDANGLPQSVLASDAQKRVVSQWNYDLQPREAAFPAATFSFEFAPDLLIEDARLKAIGDYAGNSAADKFNLGAALARQAEDWPAAFAAWESASQLSIGSSAPQFAIYEGAILTRNLERAEHALEALSTLLGEDTPEVAGRRAALLTARREWQAAQTILEKAVRLRPQDLSTRLALAELLRARSDFAGARAQLSEILKSETGSHAAKARAAEMMALLARGDAAKGVLPPAGQGTLWQQLARAHADLQNGNASAFESDDLDALESFAGGLERAGRDEEAIAAWRKILERAAYPSDKNARMRLMALHALRGEIAPSLAQYQALTNASTSLETKGGFQNALLGAWQKSNRQRQLKAALEVRAGASEDDARLWLKYQETFGGIREIEAAIDNGLARFDRSAWWHGRKVEFLSGRISQTSDAAARDRLQREALSSAEDAVGLDPEQPYYAIQRAAILTQRATPFTVVVDRGRFAGARKTASAALEELLQNWPGDPDVQIAVASQRLALENDGAHGETIALLQSALREGVPDGAQNRHGIAFSSRQVLASALRRDKKWPELAAQYPILFQASQNVDEELGVALNHFRWLMNRQQANGLAAALLDFAREPWPFDDSQQLIQPLVNVVLAKEAAPGKPSFGAQVLTILQNRDDPYAKLMVAYFQLNAAREARQIAAGRDAPDDARAIARRATADAKTAVEALAPLANGKDKILASRAAALLGEEAINHQAFDQAQHWLSRAIALEPHDVNLRVALATSLLASGKTDEAVAVRDDALQALPPTYEVLQRLTSVSLNIAQPEDRANTARIANAAMNLGRILPAVSADQWQFAALLAARANMIADNEDAATMIYTELTNPQWGILGRAVALMDWESSLRKSGRAEQADQITAQVAAMKLTPQQRQMVKNAWASLY